MKSNVRAEMRCSSSGAREGVDNSTKMGAREEGGCSIAARFSSQRQQKLTLSTMPGIPK
jgi:hypothetical protein